jgi:phosphonatase-like hydrolase
MRDRSISRRQSIRTLAAASTVGASLADANPSAKEPAIRLVVLDVGGTIVEDRGDVPKALERAFAKHGLNITPAEIAELRGASKREVVQHFVELRAPAGAARRENLIAVIYADFSRQVIDSYKAVPPIAGAEEAFKKMRADGLLLATTTGFDREITSSIMTRLGWQKYFAAMVSSDDVAEGRPAPYMIFHAMESARVNSVREVVAVGDTPLDLEAGTNASLRGVIGVLSGVSTAARLREKPHTHILRSVAELPELLHSRF